MKILLTGGAGFIGSHVAEAFVAAGHEVVVVDDLSSGRREHIPGGARLEVLDIRDRAVEDLFAREQPAVLCHHAAQMSVQRSVAEPMLDAQINLLGLLNLMEAGRRHGLRRVLLASTGGAIYGDQAAIPASEDHPTAPLSPYGVAKLASERYLYFYAQTYGIPFTALRYANVYGPRQSPHGEAGVVAIFARHMLGGGTPVINGDGEQTRDYINVSDVARANLLALDADFCGVMNIGTGVETSVNEIFRGLCRAGGFGVSEQHGPAKPGEQRRSAVDCSLARKLLNWQPQIDLTRGLTETLDFFRNQSA